ncbi:hypothetical protein BC834DRAFT_909522 [Gloeopeniophorella convolvens]|nr:hypothetical protein BC834DRAFT_909522 [Gloeopeniophorella convolvens]
MDLGKTALGNWKAQQGGCTHIQVGYPSSFSVLARTCLKTECVLRSSSTTSATSNTCLAG